MAYDAARHVTVLFSGAVNGASANDETWEWNGASWTQRLVSGPGGRFTHGMAYDTSRRVVVLFGGTPGFQQPSNEGVWEWNGTEWRGVDAGGPSRQNSTSLAYDQLRGVCVLVGGVTGAGPSGDTWEWNGVFWRQRLGPGPGNGAGYAMAYDSHRGVTFLYGGSIGFQTWELGTGAFCISPLTQPLPQTTCLGGLSSFSVATNGIGPFTYQWQIQTSPPPNETWLNLTSNPVPLPCGATSYATATPANASTTSIFVRSTCPPPPGTPPGAPTRWPIRCIVSNACGSVTSSAATLTICAADFNCTGGIEINDIFAFLNAWFASDPSSDFDVQNNVDIQDIFAFLNAWFAGC